MLYYVINIFIIEVIISNNTNGHLQQMKKTKSASLIKIPSLATSSKKSVHPEINPPLWSRLTATRSIKNLAITKPLQQFYNELETDATSSQQLAQTNVSVCKPAAILRNKLNGLHTAIDCLQQEIAESRQFGKNKGKDYEEQLKKHEQISKSVKSCQSQLNFNKQKQFQISNNISMLNQDFQSHHTNIQQSLAQKQYCDQILSQYQREHESQSQALFELLLTENSIKKTKEQIKKFEEELLKNQKQLEEWKNQIEYDLQEKIIKNKITQLRVELIRAEESVNLYATDNKLVKIREILCTHLKEIGQASRYWAIENQANEGLEVSLCRNGGLQEFQEAVLRYRGKDKTKYEPKAIKPYFQILHKIQQLLTNPKWLLFKKIHTQYTQQISSLRIKILQLQQKWQNQTVEKKQLSQKLQLVFANDSVAIIEHLRQKSGRYDINSIKSTLKELKDQQKGRVQKIRQVYCRCEKINGMRLEVDHVGFMNRLQVMTVEREKVQEVVANLGVNLKNLQKIKEGIENQISLAVSKWGELSCKKQELKQLYKDLNKLNKQIRQADLLRFKQKQTPQALKTSEAALLASKKSQIISKCMRETLKLRINGTMGTLGALRANKQNQSYNNLTKMQKSDSKTFRNKQSKQTSQQNCRTRKCSLVETMPENKGKNVGRDSLTAVLFSKFAL